MNICSAAFEFLHVDGRRRMVQQIGVFSQLFVANALREGDTHTSGNITHRGRLK